MLYEPPMSTSPLRTTLVLLGSVATAFALQACGGSTNDGPMGSSGSASSGTSSGTGTGSASGSVAPPLGTSDFEAPPAPGLKGGGALAAGGGAPRVADPRPPDPPPESSRH